MSLNITDWHDAPRAVSSRSENSLSPTFKGVIGTLMLHALIIQSIYSGHFQHATRLIMQRPGQVADTNGSGNRLVLVELALMGKSRQVNIDDSSRQSSSKSTIKPFLDVDMPPFLNIPVALDDKNGSDDSGSLADAAEDSRLVGIYTGQIQARIERIWRRPRTPVTAVLDQMPIDTDESFQCEAQIAQDERGNVLEVMLPRCNGSVSWQESLVTAIRQASPLPAPPSERVFNTSIVLHFIGLPYSKSSDEDEYEVERMIARER